MKKLFAIGIAAALALSTGVVVFAESSEKTIGGNESQSINVIAKRTDTTENNVVYSVDITWSDFNFEYNTGSNGVWDPATHSYSEAKPKGWGDQKGTIKVTNRSNADVKYTITYNKGDSKYDNFYLARNKGWTTPMTSTGGNIQSAVGIEVEKAPSHNLAFYPGGTLPKGTNNATIGSLTVAIEPIK